jgi:hypothetical protein
MKEGKAHESARADHARPTTASDVMSHFIAEEATPPNLRPHWRRAADVRIVK